MVTEGAGSNASSPALNAGAPKFVKIKPSHKKEAWNKTHFTLTVKI